MCYDAITKFGADRKASNVVGVLQEVTSADITREHVEERVQNWKARIEGLYDQLEEWLPANWHAHRHETVQMNEQMMREFSVAPVRLHALKLKSDDGELAEVEPRGLWIVGANGRLDLLTAEEHYIIVDRAENFAAPQWQISPLNERRESRPFTAETFRSILTA